MIRSRRVKEARWLSTIDRFLEIAMKKGILVVQLTERPRVGGGDAEDDADGSGFDDGGESFPVVDAGLLSETTQYPTSFVPCQGPVGMKRVMVDPLAGHNIATCRTRH